jgi:hypothetical protein
MKEAAAALSRDGIARIAQIKDYSSVLDDERALSFRKEIDQLAFEVGHVHRAKRIPS